MKSNIYPREVRLCIGGQWRGSETRQTIAVTNPATGEQLGEVVVAHQQDIDDAIHAAEKGFETWSRTSAWERDAVLRKAAELVDGERERLALLLTLENGKPLADSHGELDRVIETIIYCAEECKRSYGRVLPPRTGMMTQVSVKRPLGPVAAFVPWNFPAVLMVRKVAAALAAGCTVVLKPAEETPAICAELTKLFLDAGVPSGALNLLYGEPAEISERLIASPVIRKVSFTGSIPVGKLLAEQAGRFLKPVTMELGGHAPVLIFDDVDVEQAARACVGFKFRNAGQVCLSPSRFYVQSSIVPAFIERFAELARAIKVGNGLDDGVQMGPLNNERRVQAIQGLVDDARAGGATVVTGGDRTDGPGYFFPPTVLTNLSYEARMLNEEPFGPVAPIMPFDSFDEVMDRANSLEFGLAAYAFTNQLERAAAFSEQIQAGWIGINNFTPSLAEVPICGVKDSGLGCEGGPEGLDAYQYSSFISQSNRTV